MVQLENMIYTNYFTQYGENYNHGHNIMRIFDVLPNFPFTTSVTKPDY